MQAARLLEPRPRNLGSKLIEMARAVQLEARYGRSGVLGIWLTLAPLGGNLEGVRAGALAWFGKPAEALEPAEAALLVAIPRRPEGLRPDRHPQAAEAVRRRVLALGRALPCFPPVPSHPSRSRASPCRATRRNSSPRCPAAACRHDARCASAASFGTARRERLQTLPARVSLAMLVADAQTREIRAAYAGTWGDQQPGRGA